MQKALTLSEEERAELACSLIDSLDQPWTKAQRALGTKRSRGVFPIWTLDEQKPFHGRFERGSHPSFLMANKKVESGMALTYEPLSRNASLRYLESLLRPAVTQKGHGLVVLILVFVLWK